MDYDFAKRVCTSTWVQINVFFHDTLLPSPDLESTSLFALPDLTQGQKLTNSHYDNSVRQDDIKPWHSSKDMQHIN